jgi:hypothetical protein
LKSNIERFNFKKPLLGSVTVCLPVSVIKAIGDVVSLNENMENLKYLPEFRVQE